MNTLIGQMLLLVDVEIPLFVPMEYVLSKQLKYVPRSGIQSICSIYTSIPFSLASVVLPLILLVPVILILVDQHVFFVKC